MNFFKQFFNALQPDKFFLVCASISGLLFLVLVPPFQAPDEINNFYRAYQIANGQLISQSKDNRMGGEIPQSLLTLAEPFQRMSWTKQENTNTPTILEKLDIPLNPTDKTFVSFSNAATCSSISYVPQATILFYVKPFEPSPLSLFYFAKIATLLFWIIGIYYAIRFVPFYKWTFVMIALMPMSVLTNLSIAADAVTNVLAFLLIAYVFKLAYEEPLVSRKHFLVLAGLTVLLASAKIVYMPLLLIILLIPKKKFGAIRVYYKRLFTLGLIGLMTVLFWFLMIKDFQLHFHPSTYTLINFEDLYHLLAYLLIALIAMMDGHNEFHITTIQKGVLLFSFVGVLVLILLSQHYTFGGIGDVHSIQGRGFIPVVPLLFFVFYNQKFMSSKRVVYLVVIFALFSLTLVFNVLYNKYLRELKEIAVMKVTCDGENKIDDNLFKSNLPLLVFENGTTQSKDKARSGIFSAKVNADNPFTFTCRLFHCEKGDHIAAEVWRYGKSGRITLINNKYHLQKEILNPVEKDSRGWERLELDYIVPEDLRGDTLTIYLFNNEPDVTYFDDLRIVQSRYE